MSYILNQNTYNLSNVEALILDDVQKVKLIFVKIFDVYYYNPKFLSLEMHLDGLSYTIFGKNGQSES